VQYRRLGKTGYEVSAIGFGAWAIGGSWGRIDDDEAMRALHAAVDAGTNLIDTADVYGDGHSEQLIGRLLRDRSGERIIVATKMGRRVDQTVANYRPEAFAPWIDRSRDNLGVDRLDLVQLHCPPTDVYYHPELFAALDDLVASGAIAHYGVSVEKVEEALKAIEYPGVASVQLIFNIVRQRPADSFLAEAARRDVGVLARVPLASGLLTGKLSRASTFEADDHRAFNRHGESFDVGETFAGLDYETGLGLVEELRSLVPAGATMAQVALRWILMWDGVTAAIPGARSPEQAQANASAADLPALSPETMTRIRRLYEERAMPLVHQRW
jgi:aryl-alcohol dehydrogenase-like predicted oxidoreductase